MVTTALKVTELIPDDLRRVVRRSKQPDWIEPMLATLTEQYFSDPAWVFEPKLDGIRCLAFKVGTNVRLMSRNRLSLNERYPEVAAAVSKVAVRNCILDGEVAAVSKGVSSFQSLQRHLLEGGGSIVYYVFDAPHIGGYDVTKLPLLARKELLKHAVAPTKRVHLVTHRKEKGEAYLKAACEKGWEGLIAKRASAPYVPGRSKEWLKF
jgi:bifunctional non-homologous end joining protein LigD